MIQPKRTEALTLTLTLTHPATSNSVVLRTQHNARIDTTYEYEMVRLSTPSKQTQRFIARAFLVDFLLKSNQFLKRSINNLPDFQFGPSITISCMS